MQRKGFTLIELLVVVLIIGILAAGALPPYKIAVLQARLTQLTDLVDAAKKGVDLYLLSEGWPAEDTVLTAEPSPLDIKIPGECDEGGCRSKAGYILVHAHPDHASIIYEAEGSWSDDAGFQLGKSPEIGRWVVVDLWSDNEESLSILCRYLKEHGYEDGGAGDTCADVNVILPGYEPEE